MDGALRLLLDPQHPAQGLALRFEKAAALGTFRRRLKLRPPVRGTHPGAHPVEVDLAVQLPDLQLIGRVAAARIMLLNHRPAPFNLVYPTQYCSSQRTTIITPGK